MNNDYDILIVGAGMVGASLALTLAALPLRIALVENFPLKTEAQLDADGRSIALNFASVAALQKINVWKNLQKFATPIHEVHVSERGRFGKMRIKASEENVNALGYVVPAPILGVELNKMLLASAQITLFNPVQVQTLTSLSSEFRLSSRNDESFWAAEVKTPAGAQTIKAKLIIAADGTHSTIRKLQNIQVEEKDYHQSIIVTSVKLLRGHNNIAYERFTDHGAIALLPLLDNRAAIAWTGSNEFIAQINALNDEDFLQQAQAYFGYRLGKFSLLGKRHVHALKMMVAKEQVRNGLVLIGNAAHTVHPIAAQGFNLGVTDVNLLAKLIADAIKTEKNFAALEVLQKYETTCVRAQQKIIKFTDSLTHLFLQDFLPLSMARNAGLLTLDMLRPLKRRLAKRLMGMTVK